jgi:hypothetical protein
MIADGHPKPGSMVDFFLQDAAVYSPAVSLS